MSVVVADASRMGAHSLGLGAAEVNHPEPISTHILFSTRDSAGKDIAAFWTLLSERLNEVPSVCALRLGVTLDLPVLSLQALEFLQPDFSSLSFTESSKRACLILRQPESLLPDHVRPHTPALLDTQNTQERQTGAEPSPGQYFENHADFVVALADPLDTELQTWLQNKVQAGQQDGRRTRIQWHIVHPSDLQAYCLMQEGRLQAMDKALSDVQPEVVNVADAVDHVSLESISQESSPIVRLVNSTILDAMKAQASDIHLEALASGLKIKYRIDGVLCGAGQMPGREAAAQVVSRIKVMAELDISEQRIPQDGRFKLRIRQRDVDFRVSVMPSLFGEDVVIRILDKLSLTNQMQSLSLELLGYEGRILRQVRNLARESYGMLLVTGPTGSGKTTTLYAALTEINSGDQKIVTIEDPIEYELPGVLQIPVNEKKGLTFAKGLRSILRHDPDKILVGEIRDSETAQIAIQSALTGHLVFTSVHANNVFDVLGRFIHLGVDTFSFVSALNGVLAQRLVRAICPHCREPHVLDAAEVQEQLGLDCGAVPPALFRGKGCGHCRGTGYKGRRAISELLILDDEMREMIIARAPIRALKDLARSKGTVFLRDAAVQAALAGWTTVEEINRVSFAQQY